MKQRMTYFYQLLSQDTSSSHAFQEVYQVHQEEFLNWSKRYFPGVAHEEKCKAFSQSVIFVKRKIQSGQLKSLEHDYLFNTAKHILIMNTLATNQRETQKNGDIIASV